MYQNITSRIKEQVRKIITTNANSIPDNKILVELIDNGLDILNRTKVGINIIIISQGTFILYLVTVCNLQRFVSQIQR